MLRVAIALIIAGSAWVGWTWVGLEHVFVILQPMVIVATIMIAAIFVRLNRGMPTLEWKSVDPSSRSELTSAIVAMARHYVGALCLISVLLLFALALMAIGFSSAIVWSPSGQAVACALFIVLVSLSICHMAIIVWRDLDVIVLQKKLIDTLADKEAYDANVQAGGEKAAAIKANLRPVPSSQPKAWGE